MGNDTKLTVDPFGKTVKIVETVASSITSTKQLIWCPDNTQPSAVRDQSGSVTTNLFAYGQAVAAGNYYYTADLDLSVRELTNTSGQIALQQAFDSYGNAIKLQSSGQEPEFGYAGYYVHSRSGLGLTSSRVYSARNATFLSPETDRVTDRNLIGYPEAAIEPKVAEPTSSVDSADLAFPVKSEIPIPLAISGVNTK